MPEPVDVNIVPGLLSAASINVKSVVPGYTITYSVPVTIASAVIESVMTGYISGTSQVTAKNNC